MIIVPSVQSNIILPKNDLIVVPNTKKIITSVSYDQILELQQFDAAKLRNY
jgi:hypothetical protein